MKKRTQQNGRRKKRETNFVREPEIFGTGEITKMKRRENAWMDADFHK